jgi:hypothetical protein
MFRPTLVNCDPSLILTIALGALGPAIAVAACVWRFRRRGVGAPQGLYRLLSSLRPNVPESVRRLRRQLGLALGAGLATLAATSAVLYHAPSIGPMLCR